MRHSATGYIVGALHVLGWGGLLLSAPSPLIAGLGVTAYLLGLRHAFDADHIAAIDNTTRQLLARNRPARGVGLWFSLGHATVVAALCVLLALGVGALTTSLEDPDSPLQVWTGVIGPVVSGVFLVVIAVANLLALRHRRRAGSGHPHGGPAWALLGRLSAVIDRPSRMYVVGLLFGLGFDTATEIGLLALAGTAASRAVPWWTVLLLPVLFAAGMSLLDSAQGAMSRRAYSWRATGREGAGRRYDVLVTGASIVVALVIGVAELAGVAVRSLPQQGLARALADLDLNALGVVLTAVLIACWAAAALWSGALRGRPPVRRSSLD
ncbi:Nickel/cobalt efflux system [Microbacterium sp. 8M]|uniref:HoxN/HupN/NixA family nickel/cobalt transporter n=1 Tax=Microbacterium sp. 8M TaxID=2653153 RepID=UPI0012F13D88|nr:high-affinity nickel-transport protein [Microbacterium sp. 8M]VXC08354.1 Nickel/cobalt efflux system [Microbacterium sp. 8M]